MRCNLPVSYLPVSEDRKTEMENVIREANLLVRHYAGKSDADCVREGILSGTINIPPQEAEKIRKAREMEWEVLCAFANLIAKIANKWASKTRDPSLSVEDLTNEAIAKAVKAIRHFTQDNIRLSTFLHVCVNRRLSELCMKSGSIARIPRSLASMKFQYMALASEEGATFDSVVQKMGLSEKRVADLLFVLKGVACEAENDCQMRIVDESRGKEEDFVERPGIMSVIGSLDLSDLERAVLEGFLRSEGKMGISKFSKKMINPNTKKPYSRMAFSLAWTRVKNKIARAYSDVA